jgi:hypothetical protein
MQPPIPVELDALTKLFDAAAVRQCDAANKAYQYLQAELADTLRDHFDVGWGKRLETQLKAFVPVVVEAGGTVGEAVDHLLSTKILRKVRGRHDVELDDFDTLLEVLEHSWPTLDGSSEPSTAMGILRTEQRRLAGGRG